MSLNSDSTTDWTSSITPDADWLLRQYPVHGEFDETTGEYQKLGVDSPSLITHLRTDLRQMGQLRATACYESVVNTITDYLGERPIFDSITVAPALEDASERRAASLTTFLIGHDLDTRSIPSQNHGVSEQSQVVIDADVIGVVASDSGVVEESLINVASDLLSYDYVVLCQVIDGVLYSGGQVAGPLDTDQFPEHISSELSTRHRLLLDNPSFYEDIYTPIFESLANEHYRNSR